MKTIYAVYDGHPECIGAFASFTSAYNAAMNIICDIARANDYTDEEFQEAVEELNNCNLVDGICEIEPMEFFED